ncbi:MAG: alpha/beta fold hydrolase [Haloarculaceae archaeon]
MSWNHEYARVDGIELHYVREGSGVPLLLVHGWPEYRRAWRKNVPALADSFDVIVPDLAGFGDSGNPKTPAGEGYGIEDHAADLTGLADALGVEEFGFVSHDLGAYVGQRIARERPERVRGLFFFDCPYPGIGERWRDPDHVGEIWYQSFNQQPWAADLVGATRETCRTYIEHFLTHWAGDPDAFDEADRDAWVDTFRKPGNLQGGFDWYLAAEEGRRRLMREGAPSMDPIEVPTRILWGELDPVVKSEWADRLDEYFADYRLDTVPDAGHFVHYERPDLANGAIESFFADAA